MHELKSQEMCSLFHNSNNNNNINDNDKCNILCFNQLLKEKLKLKGKKVKFGDKKEKIMEERLWEGGRNIMKQKQTLKSLIPPPFSRPPQLQKNKAIKKQTKPKERVKMEQIKKILLKEKRERQKEKERGTD